MKEQMVFEKNVFNKTSRTESEIAFFGGMTIVYKSSIDLFLYVVGSSHENELMLMSVLTCLFESLSHMLRKNVEKRWLLENMDGAFLVLDEIVDGGVILESDPQQVIQKVNFRADDSSLTEQSVTQTASFPRSLAGCSGFVSRPARQRSQARWKTTPQNSIRNPTAPPRGNDGKRLQLVFCPNSSPRT
uniref:Coatomer subunit zeta n=1 Tax=Sciurus vulgaris TaxID=55149 RepID=A0A8D2DGB7_SCIVU